MHVLFELNYTALHFQAVNLKTLCFDIFKRTRIPCLDLVTRLDCMSSIAVADSIAAAL